MGNGLEWWNDKLGQSYDRYDFRNTDISTFWAHVYDLALNMSQIARRRTEIHRSSLRVINAALIIIICRPISHERFICVEAACCALESIKVSVRSYGTVALVRLWVILRSDMVLSPHHVQRRLNTQHIVFFIVLVRHAQIRVRF